MKQGQLQQLLAATNGWRRDPVGWAREDPDLVGVAGAPFRYDAGVLRDLAPGAIHSLRGPRRVGKSVVMKRAIESLLADGVAPNRITHFALDGWRADELRGLIRATRAWLPEEGPRYWFLDEITGVRGWAEEIKWLRDNDLRFRADTVVLTGSSAADLTASIGTLAGRRGPATYPDRTLLPMGFASFAQLVLGDEAPPRPDVPDTLALDRLKALAVDVSPWLETLVFAWENYLRVGGFPRAVWSWVENRSLESPVTRELTEQLHGRAFRSGEWSRLQSDALLARIAQGLGSPSNVAAIARDLGVLGATARRRLDDLRDSFAIWPCFRERALRPMLRAQEKLYFTDPAFAGLMTGPPPEVTRLSEQQLGMVLGRRAERQTPGSFPASDQVLHHRDPGGLEIDFVAPGLGDFAFESKYVDTGARRELQRRRNLAWPVVIATRGELNLDAPQLPAIPTGILAWLLDT